MKYCNKIFLIIMDILFIFSLTICGKIETENQKFIHIINLEYPVHIDKWDYNLSVVSNGYRNVAVSPSRIHSNYKGIKKGTDPIIVPLETTIAGTDPWDGYGRFAIHLELDSDSANYYLTKTVWWLDVYIDKKITIIDFNNSDIKYGF